MTSCHQLSEHPLQIATLGLWLSIAAAALIGLGIRPHDSGPDVVVGDRDGAMAVEMVVGDPFDAAAAGPDDAADVTVAQELAPMPDPPVLPAMTTSRPLPVIPDVRRPSPVASTPPAPRIASPSAGAAPSTPGPASRPASRPASGSQGGGGAASLASRLAAGNMPAPAYPVEARRRGQVGTVVVEFTVGESGRVLSARLVEPSRWPILNREALRAVRGWKFPAGDVMTIQRPIVFQLR